MINILIATHGPLGQGLIKASELIMGESSNIHSIGLFLGDSPDEFYATVDQAIDNNYNEDGLLIFTDLYGGTPANAVLSKLNKLNFPNNIACYVGVNLPLLLEAIAMIPNCTIDTVKNHLNSIMVDTISNVSDAFAGK